MIQRLICKLFGHRDWRWATLDDGTRIFGCSDCGSYKPRELTTDVRRPIINHDPRYQVTKRDQARARWTGLQRLRTVPRSENPDIVKEQYRAS